MEVVLVSKDTNLQKICRELLGEILGRNWGFTVADVDAPIPSADLYIWDFHPGMALPENPEWQKHIILLQREHLPCMQESNFPAVNVILKPFTEATLRSFLEQSVALRVQQDALGDRIQNLYADRDQLLQCVIQANLKLQQYDQDRTNFLARAIHDFRAPLTALSGYCGLLLGGHLGDLLPDQREVMQRMQTSAQRLSRMANAMFELSIRQRVDRPQSLEENDIQETVDQALHETLPFLEEKHISVAVNLKSPGHPLLFEKAQIEQLLINLLDNASKFTPRNGSIQINGYPFFWDRRRSNATHLHSADRRSSQNRSANSYRIDVRDSGPGIPEAQLEQIFEEYTSYSGGNDRSGGGLGLAICRMIISQHEGQIWAQNTTEGTVFSFVLPFRRPSAIIPDTRHLGEDALLATK
jgi:signal transduction histidine kinase